MLSMLVGRPLNWRRLEWERRSGLNGGSQLEVPSKASISTYLYVEGIASRMVTIGSELKG